MKHPPAVKKAVSAMKDSANASVREAPKIGCRVNRLPLLCALCVIVVNTDDAEVRRGPQRSNSFGLKFQIRSCHVELRSH